MNKKGFTLVELLAVIIIISVLSLLVFPAVNDMIINSKKSSYETGVESILSAAEKWAMENTDKLDENHLNSVYLNLEVLRNGLYLDKDEIKNPDTGENMAGCIEISYNNSTSQYNYTYSDYTCTFYTDSLSDVHGTIYSKTGTEDKNKISPFGQYLIENSSVVFENNKYVFKGDSTDNYVVLDGKTYRIISVSEDYEVKLIRQTSISSSWCDASEYLCSNLEFKSSKVYTELLSVYTSELSDTYGNKIVQDYKWNDGVVDYSNDMLNITLLSNERSSSVESNVGLLTISDYRSSIDSANSYLDSVFSTNSTWLLNSDGIDSMYIQSNGNILKHVPSDSDITYRAYLTVVFDKSTFIESGTGISSDAYILK